MSERVVIDKAGRIVIPKSLRESLGFEEGDLLLVEQQDGALLVRPQEVEDGLIRRDGRLFKPAVRGARKITVEEVRKLTHSLRMRGMPSPKRSRRKKSRA